MDDKYEIFKHTCLESLIEIKIESAYRRGYSHGFEVGVNTKEEEVQPLRNEIQEWRYNQKLTEIKGAPGSVSEGIMFVELPTESEKFE